MSRSMDRQTAALLLERSETDDVWLARLRSAYRGRHDVLDALWWVAHPLSATSRGIPDPSSELAELKRAVFSRSASESPFIESTDPLTGEIVRVRQSEHRLREVQRVLAEDTRALLQAVEAVEEPTEKQSPAAGSEITDNPEHQPFAPPHAATTTSSRKGARAWLPVGALAALLAGVLLWPGFPGATLADVPPPPAPAVATERTTISVEEQFTAPLTLLAEPTAEGDVPQHITIYRHELEAVRALPHFADHVELYVARQVDGPICLIAGYSDGTVTAQCEHEESFLENGIVFGPNSGTYPLPDDRSRRVVSETATLWADGTFLFHSVIEDSVTTSSVIDKQGASSKT